MQLRPTHTDLLSLHLKASCWIFFAFFSRVDSAHRHHQRLWHRPCVQPTQNTAMRDTTQGPDAQGSLTRCVTHLRQASHWSPLSLQAFIGCRWAMFVRCNHMLKATLVSIRLTTFITSSIRFIWHISLSLRGVLDYIYLYIILYLLLHKNLWFWLICNYLIINNWLICNQYLFWFFHYK